MHTHLGVNFRRVREIVGFTQAQVARYLGVDQSYVSKFENQEREFSMELLMKAAELFGCSLDALADADGDVSPLPIAMHAAEIQDEDLAVIATMNKLALNLRFMEALLREVQQ